MEQEDYVSFEVAKLLKRKGYTQNTQDGGYYRYGDDRKTYWYSFVGAYEVVDKVKDYYQRPSITYPCPTLYDVQKWLRDEKNIWVSVFPIYDKKYQIIDYRVRISTYWDLEENKKGKLLPLWFEKYEQALDEGIKEALKLI